MLNLKMIQHEHTGDRRLFHSGCVILVLLYGPWTPITATTADNDDAMASPSSDITVIIGINYVDQPGSVLDKGLMKKAIEKATQVASEQLGVEIVLVQSSHDACQNTQTDYDFHRAINNVENMLWPHDPKKATVQAIIGSPCAQEFLAQAALCAYHAVEYTDVNGVHHPEITPTRIYTGGARLALHIDQLPNAFRVSYSIATQWDAFFYLCRKYSWKHVALVYDADDPEFKQVYTDFATIARSNNHLVVSGFNFRGDVSATPDWTVVLGNVQNNSRVIRIHQLMLAANSMDMCNGSYAFFAFDPMGEEVLKRTADFIYGAASDGSLISAYSALQVFSLARIALQSTLIGLTDDLSNVITASYWQIAHYNALIMAAYFLVNAGNPILPGSNMTTKIYDSSFFNNFPNLFVPDMYMHNFGDISEPMDILNFNAGTRKFERACTFEWIRVGDDETRSKLHDDFQERPSLETLNCSQTLRWGPTTTPPEDEPQCGFTGERCKGGDLTIKIAVSVSCGTTFVAIMIFLGYAWQKRRHANKAKNAWLLKWEDVIIPTTSNLMEQKLRKEAMRLGNDEKFQSSTMRSVEAADQQTMEEILPYGVYWNKKLYMVRLSSKYRLQMSKKVSSEIQHVIRINHENVAKFEGACLDPDHVFVLYEYCAKGTLQELLLDTQHKLDWTIRFSLLSDIVKALAFIHPSPLTVCHGRLTSACCFIDSRFVLKVADYGMNSYYELSVAEQWAKRRGSNYFTEMLWTAPEHMRVELIYGKEPPKAPTKAGDIYSYGIILQETILRILPFGMYGTMTAEDIVDQIRKPNTGKDVTQPPFRPVIPDESANPGLIEMAKKSWSQIPNDRPGIKQIKYLMRSLGKSLGFGDKVTILDTLLEQMDDLMTNLQVVTDERGRVLLKEKICSEDLLFRLLPRAVAECMKTGEQIHPENYQSCSILLFSVDNFARIVADYAVLQLTNFVMDLHAFIEERVLRYDCLKVDFHDSMGTVASGIPTENGTAHASQITKLALHLLCSVRQFDMRHPTNEAHVCLAIGFNTGPCVTAVIGDILPQYCVFGETIQTTLRLLEAADEHNALCSTATKNLLNSDFMLVEHGEIFVKGKGIMTCYSIRGVIGDPEMEVLQRRYYADRSANQRRHPSFV